MNLRGCSFFLHIPLNGLLIFLRYSQYFVLPLQRNAVKPHDLLFIPPEILSINGMMGGICLFVLRGALLVLKRCGL